MENQRKKKVKNKSYEILNEVLISWNDSSSEDSGIIQANRVKENFYSNPLDYFLNNFYFDGDFEMWNPYGWVFTWNNQITVIMTNASQDLKKWKFKKFDSIYNYAMILGDIYTWHMKNIDRAVDRQIDSPAEQYIKDEYNDDHDLPWVIVSSDITDFKNIINAIKEDTYFAGYKYRGKVKTEFFEYDKMVKSKKELKVPVSLEYV